MFTIEQIKEAHKQVKSGADFPAYIQVLKSMGVIVYQTWVKNSLTDFFGTNDFKIVSKPMYDDLKIESKSDEHQFVLFLKIHQNGETDYLTFCKHCAETGVEKWISDLNEMTCSYYDKTGNTVLVEKIPG